MTKALVADAGASRTYNASPPFSLLALYLLLGVSAGLPFYMFSTVLSLRLTEHGVGLVVIGFFAWVTLLPTFKFLWAPLLDRFSIPGFGRFWGKRRGWIMLSQLGIFTSMVALAFTSDESLAVTALFAVLLAFWTTTLEIAVDAWRIELAPTEQEQGPIVAANLWGYRSAMVAAGSGALIIADQAGWIAAYLAIAVVAFLPLPILAALKADPVTEAHCGSRWSALLNGSVASTIILFATLVLFSGAGWMLLEVAAGAGINSKSNVAPFVFGVGILPFVLLALALPKIKRAPFDSPLRRSAAIGPFVDIFWRFGFASLGLLAFVSLYRMGDVLALTLSKPFVKSLGYSLTQIGVADGVVALLASMAGVGLGGFLVTRWRHSWTLGLGALLAGLGNWVFIWLQQQGVSESALYLATAADQFGNGFAGTVFVVYMSMLVNPRYAGAQYAFLLGFAFMLPRLLAGTSGYMEAVIGYDGFFLLSGALSFAAILFLPLLARMKARPSDEPA